MRGLIAPASTLAGTTLVVTMLACTTDYPPCYRGEYQACLCAGGASGANGANGATRGYQVCNVTEDGFQACVCDGTTPGVDGGRDASSGEASVGDASLESSAPGTSTYMTPCGPNGECRGPDARCFEFATKGKTCTKTCAQASDCPAPSPGCAPSNGVCRAP
jgi:hypothetical protein